MSGDALLIAEDLLGRDDDALAELATLSRIAVDRVDDVFDLAEALLAPEAVQRRLSALDRLALAALATAGAADTTLGALIADLADAGRASDPGDVRRALGEASRLALARLVPAASGEELQLRIAVPDAVAERLAAWPDEGLPGALELAGAHPPACLAAVEEPDPDDDERTGETAWLTVQSAADLLAELGRSPARELAKGGLGLPERSRLAQAVRRDVDEVTALVDVLRDARLVAVDARTVAPTAAADRWRAGTTPERWSRLATAWLARIPDAVRRVLADRLAAGWGDGVLAQLDWLYPAAGADAAERLERARRDALALGLGRRDAAASGSREPGEAVAPTALARALLTSGPRAAEELAARMLPAEVDRVYVQPDASIIAPGPLAPDLASRLALVADVESRTLAATYRITAASVDRALAAGETADALRSFLTGLSLTGLPQPIDYLLGERAARQGLVRVEDDEAGSLVTSSDPALLAALATEPSLAALRLDGDGDGLRSREAPSVVRAALAAIDAPVAAARTGGVRVPGDDDGDAPRAVAMARRVRARSQDADAADAWLARRLESAARSHTIVVVTVALPDGSAVDWTVEPTGVSGGRMRAKDRAADLERTVPLDRVTAVRLP